MVDKKSDNLRLVFMGTPDFSVPILNSIVAAEYNIVCVYSQPPRARGRGQKESKTPIHAKAQEFGINVRTPNSLSSIEETSFFKNLDIDCAVVVAYGLILPEPILAAPRLGCLNIHASLLPRWRGAAPIQRSILAGDSETGVTIMKMDQGLDTGAILMAQKVPITIKTNGESLHNELSEVGANLILTALDGLKRGLIVGVAQPKQGVTYANKLERSEGQINWQRPAIELERVIRAYTPWPGSWFKVGKERIKILAADYINYAGVPGTILDEHLTIACGEGALRLKVVQRAGKSPTATSDFLRGFPVPIGSQLD
jgi:methionyl-tRNA formyltransferase